MPFSLGFHHAPRIETVAQSTALPEGATDYIPWMTVCGPDSCLLHLLKHPFLVLSIDRMQTDNFKGCSGSVTSNEGTL